MAYSNSSAAYDFTAFEMPKEKKKPAAKVKLLEQKKRRYTIAALVSPRVFSTFAIVITLICLMVYNQVHLNEISNQISRINSQISTLESENVAMSSRLESTVSIRTVGEIAQNELGMQRLDKYQIEYLNLYQEDTIELAEDAPQESLMERMKLAINSVANTMKEYIGGR